MTAALLEVQGLSKHFGAVRALDDVDLSVSEGELFGLIGPNGSGKTTLFNCVTGFHRPTRGSVRWRGEAITGTRPEQLPARGLVRTFQHVMTFQSESVLRNVETALESARRNGVTPTPGLAETAGEILEFCGLAEVAQLEARHLSYGQARTLGVAITMAMSPRLLMLDEPASGLNDHESAELSQLLQALNDRGVTLLVIDHDMGFLLPLVGRVAALDVGRKIAEGPPDEVRRDESVISAYLGQGWDQRRKNRVAATVEESTAQPPPTQPPLEVESVRSGYDEADVVQGVSLRVDPGEAVAVLGANGAGKTTLLRTISGALPLRGGRIRYGSLTLGAGADDKPEGYATRLLRSLPGVRQRQLEAQAQRLFRAGIVHVPEGRHIFTGMSVRDNLLVAARADDSDEGGDTDDLLAWVLDVFPPLKEKFKAQGGSLSGGQQQMLAIGRGLMSRPRILCLDEPSLGLAPSLMESLTDQIGELHRSTGLSLLVVEQSAPMALELCDRVYIMQTGSLVHEAASDELSVEELTAGYFGGPTGSEGDGGQDGA